MKHIKLLFLFLFISGSAFAQNSIKFEISETQIENAVKVLTSSKSLNFGKLFEGDNVLSYSWYINIDDVDVDVKPNNQVELYVHLHGEGEIDVITDMLNSHGSVTADGPLYGSFSLEGDYNDGYKLIFNPSTLYASEWNYDANADDPIINALLTNVLSGVPLMAYEFPNFEVNIGSSFLPGEIATYFSSSSPSLTTDATNITLDFEVKTECLVAVRTNFNSLNNFGRVAQYNEENGLWSFWFNSPHVFGMQQFSERRIAVENNNYTVNNTTVKLFNWDGDNNNIKKELVINVDEDAIHTANYHPAVQLNINALGENNNDVITTEVMHHGEAKQTPYTELGIASPYFTKLYAAEYAEKGDKVYQFIEWEDGSTNNERLAYPTSASSYTVNYKALHNTDNLNDFTCTNQRKIIQLSSNSYIAVYESKERIWIEQSADGILWSLGNNRQPLSESNCKQPSIANYGNSIIIVYQEEYPNGYKIKMAEYNAATKTLGTTHQLFETDYTGNFEFDAQPTIAVVGGQQYLSLWRVEDLGGFNYEPGIYFLRGYRANPFSAIQWYSGGFEKLPNTTANSIYASVVGLEHSSGYYMHIVWQESNTAIKYQQTYCGSISQPLTWNWYSEVSANCGMTRNLKPEMVIMDVDLNPRVVWVGEKDTPYIEDPTKLSTVYATTKQLVLRGLQGTSTKSWNPQSWKFGNYVTEAAIERTADDGYVIGWSQNQDKKFIFNSSWTIRSFGISGTGIELNYAPTIDNVFATTIHSSGQIYTPNELLSSNIIDDLVPKENKMITSTGREGIVSTNEAEIYFTLADILVDGTLLEFVDVDENTPINNCNELNALLETKSFEVNNNTQLQLSLLYSVVNKNSISKSFKKDDFVSFKVELVDVNTNEVLGVYDEIKFTKETGDLEKVSTYSLEMDGIGNRVAKLRLVVDENVDAKFTMSHIFAEESIIGKTTIQNVSYAGKLEVTEYGLAQNYPNPFNPSTTINYQIPEAGIVTIKIFDILGREVTTLVNEQKAQGVYTVNFNAASLASGVYLYNIQVNDFSATRKMILMK